jgi:hypothetical protein
MELEMSDSRHHGNRWRRRRGKNGLLREYRESELSVGPRDFCPCCTGSDWCRVNGKHPTQKVLKKTVRQHQSKVLDEELIELNNKPLDDFNDYLVEALVEQDSKYNNFD